MADSHEKEGNATQAEERTGKGRDIYQSHAQMAVEKAKKPYSLAISYHLPCISTLTIFKDFAIVVRSTKSAFSRCE